jgi:NADH:ubiquinone oxidoreductase subunit E
MSFGQKSKSVRHSIFRRNNLNQKTSILLAWLIIIQDYHGSYPKKPSIVNLI